MTDMKRVTISVTDEIDRRIIDLRKDPRFERCSYAEIVRQVVFCRILSKSHERRW